MKNRAEDAAMRKLLAVLLLACMAACGSMPRVLDVTAQRKEHDAVAPEYLRYVDADSTLTAEQKQSRHDTVGAWALRIRKLEEALAQEVKQ